VGFFSRRLPVPGEFPGREPEPEPEPAGGNGESRSLHRIAPASSPVGPDADGPANAGQDGRHAPPPPLTDRSKCPSRPHANEEPRIHLGVCVSSGEEVSLSLAQLERPVHIQGGTGERKTLILAHLTERFIALTDAAVVYVDLSEDQAAANYVTDAAKQHGRPKRLLSTVSEHVSAWFDPMKPIYPLTQDHVVQAKDYFMAALSLSHQGKHRFWGKVNDIAFLRAFKALAARGVTEPHVEDVRQELERTSRVVRKQDMVEALLEFEQLATQRVLYRGSPADEIDYDQVLESKMVVYLLLGVLLNSAAAGVGALNAWGAVSAAIRRKRRGLPPRRLILIIDEYAMVAHSDAYRLLVVLCRKFGITLIVANQSTQQLREAGNDQIVFDSTPTKLWMSPLQDDIEIIRGLSKETWKQRKGLSYRGLSISNQVSEFRDPTAERNDVLDTAFTPMEGYLIEFGRGYVEPLRFRFEPPWTVEQWAELGERPLPMREDAKVATKPSLAPTNVPLDNAAHKRRQDVLRKILVAAKDRESWEPKSS